MPASPSATTSSDAWRPTSTVRVAPTAGCGRSSRSSPSPSSSHWSSARSPSQQRRNADRERRTATARELAAAADANVDVDPELSTLLALRAIDLTGGGGAALPDATAALHRAVGAARLLRTVPGVGGATDWSPDGRRFVTEGPEESGIVDIRDADTGASLLSFKGHDVDINDVAFSPDGSLLATTGDDGALRVWDPTTGDLVFEHVEGDGNDIVWAPAFSPDSHVVVATWFGDESVRGYDVRSGAEVLHLAYPESFSNAFSPDGKLLALGLRADGLVRILDAHSGQMVRTLQLPTLWFPRDVTFSPDGRWLATTTEDGRVIVWDVATGQPRFTAAGHSGAVNALDWSADSARLVSVGDDGTARVWGVDDGGIRQQLVLSARDSRSGLAGVAFSRDGTRIVAGDSGTKTALVWDVRPTGAAEWLTIEGLRRDFTNEGVAITPDGEEAGVIHPDGQVGLWDVATGSRRLTVGDSAGTAATRVRDLP